jgi:GT2 family glycosyltransferase
VKKESMSDKVLFSIIIPTCNRLELLDLCLRRISPSEQKLASDLFEVIVSDDGDFQVRKYVEEFYPWVIWVEGPKKGPASNRNHGASHAKGKYLVFTDDDCIPDKGWLQGYFDAIINMPAIQVFEGRTYVDEKRPGMGVMAPYNEEGGYLWSCNFLMEAGLFKKLGGFNEKFPFAAMEDVELRTRLIKGGYSFHFVPEASVNHPWRSKGGWKKLMDHQRSTFIYLKLHPDQSAIITSRYYVGKALRQMVKDTIPGVFKYKGKGLGSQLLEHIADLKMAFQLLFFKPKNDV